MNKNFGNRDHDRGDRFGSRPPRNNDFGNAPPVNVGEELDVRIEAVGEKGDGVAKKNGFVIFVPGVKEGQNVRVKVTRVLRKVGFGEVVGAAQSTPSDSPREKVKEAEPEEDYSAENDSDNFGEEESSDDSADDSEASEDFGDEEEDK